MIEAFKHSIEVEGFALISCELPDQVIEPIESHLACTVTGRSRAGMRHALGQPCILDLAMDMRLLGHVRAVLGPGAVPFRATVFDKSLRSNWLVVWHQDTALPVREEKAVAGWGPWSRKAGTTCGHAPTKELERVLALRVHLDDSTSSNGPLRVLPGTHRRGVLSDEEVQQLAKVMEPVDCLVRRGEVLAMRPLIVHASSKVRDGGSRRVIHLEYATSLAIGSGLELAVV